MRTEKKQESEYSPNHTQMDIVCATDKIRAKVNVVGFIRRPKSCHFRATVTSFQHAEIFCRKKLKNAKKHGVFKAICVSAV